MRKMGSNFPGRNYGNIRPQIRPRTQNQATSNKLKVPFGLLSVTDLKRGWEHLGELPDGVEKLDKGRRRLLEVALDVAAPVLELVAEA